MTDISPPSSLSVIKSEVDAAIDAVIAVDVEPISKLALAGAKTAFDLVVQIIDQHGQAGVEAALAQLRAIRDNGADPITDAELATDDAAVAAKIAEWYAKAT